MHLKKEKKKVIKTRQNNKMKQTKTGCYTGFSHDDKPNNH